ncbi:MAG: Asp-tRNA(Asn)/Glu-tRNA(Gln) amidotransferase subunit GatC [Planctomycetota bacterium]|jgi:aspartyl-tRNA(Asn)/glutamyl-tRNA(Gln) amidotransferase subunit C|nr:MAG: Asp-tRNA(Asn)/Glu-tRNA(Gln) amidotransferase subunit GatC [Planctomycetota bacterium]
MELSDVRKVATLARLSLSEDALQTSGEQLTKILDYVRLLDEVDTANVEPMTHPVPAENVFRDDVMSASLPIEAALSNAPKTDGHFFIVPKILEEKGA